MIRVDRLSPGAKQRVDVLARNRRSIAVDLKQSEGAEIVLKLCESADGLFEGFRPSVTERLGIGPEACMARNAKLVYGHMTGWGQEGPLAQAAGHDINYIALAGALHAIARPGEKPVPPLNLIGDFGGGGMVLAFGMVYALLEAQRSGQGQVIDAAMVDGSAALMAPFFGQAATGRFTDQRGTNMLDGGAHFYDTYETQDGKYISVGSIEPQFYALLVEKAGLDPERFSAQLDRERWPGYKDDLTRVFKSKTQAEWCAIMEGTDVCFAPVLSIFEAPAYLHHQQRSAFVEIEGVTQPAPAPRFSRTSPEVRSGARRPGEDSEAVLLDVGFSHDAIDALRAKEVIPADGA